MASVKIVQSSCLVNSILRNTHHSPDPERPAGNIGELLVRDNKLQQTDLEQALQVHGNSGNGIGPLLVRLGLVSDKDLAAAYAKRYALPVLEDNELPDAPIDNLSLPAGFLKTSNIVPISETAEHVSLAVADPEDEFPIQAVEMACDKSTVIKLATLTQVERTLDKTLW